MFGQVPPTQFDLRFSLLGVPVRIHPIFWATSAFLAWVPGALDLVFIGILCIFVSILLHELGHALVTRRFGWQPEIVLYILGGYATTMRHSTWKDIAVSAAGPAAGFLLYFSILVPLWMTDLVTPGVFLPTAFDFDLPRILEWAESVGIGRRGAVLVLHAATISLFINFVWNVMNLLPVLPLDGGQISREFFGWLRPRDGMEICLKVSIAVSGAVAAYAVYQRMHDGSVFGLSPLFLAIMFGYLCFQSYQDLQSLHRGYW